MSAAATQNNQDLLHTTWNEAECVHGCLQLKRTSQEQFYRHFYPKMMAVVMRYSSDRDTCSSILNNAFLKAFNNLKKFRNEGSLEGWIRRIVIHSVADYFRTAKNKFETSNQEIKEADVNHSTFMAEQYDYNKLLGLLTTLPAATRSVVNLFFIDGYTHREISDLLGISENTSKWHVAEGKKTLIKKLGQYQNETRKTSI